MKMGKGEQGKSLRLDESWISMCKLFHRINGSYITNPSILSHFKIASTYFPWWWWWWVGAARMRQCHRVNAPRVISRLIKIHILLQLINYMQTICIAYRIGIYLTTRYFVLPLFIKCHLVRGHHKEIFVPLNGFWLLRSWPAPPSPLRT